MDDAAVEAVGTPEPAAPGDAVGQPTGVAAVETALERLRDLDGAPVEAHVEIFDDVQRQLHEALAELDE